MSLIDGLKHEALSPWQDTELEETVARNLGYKVTHRRTSYVLEVGSIK